ncbi:hypothetical protein J7E63_16685 [Bacillus sp. ISL-75]|uniref:hypothetical protein n=1 Tax=Bacillus sp. ISL-75 TaxID=2819137 RepID=UPI001BE7A125|nr:hypothetical protein [Bacillus sp. ISL-75]MBT2728563.1 hypothetical protein [Bacillus sp. ISL-75]
MQMVQGPGWTTSDIKTINGEDHLGIRFVGISIADTLQAGITSITSRARYWSFYSWVIHDFIQNGPEQKSMKEFKQYLKKQEWYYILANIGWSVKNNMTTSGLIGSTKGSAEWNSEQTVFLPVFDYVKDSFGGYGTYRNVLKIVGLTREGNIEKGVQIDRLTSLGKELAEAYEKSIDGTVYYQKYRHSNNPVPREVLIDYGQFGGLSSLHTNALDLPLLTDIFMPKNPSGERGKLRRNSLLYYMSIIQQKAAKPFSFQVWQNLMYDGYFTGTIKVSKELQVVAIGWEIYQARQLITYSLDAIWSFLLDKMSRRIYTTPELISHVLEELSALDFNLNQSIKSIVESLDLQQKDRNNYINLMGSDEKNLISHVWSPILVMLEVYCRFKDRQDFTDLHKNLLTMGGRDSISFKTWFVFVEDYYDQTIEEFLSYIMNYFILDQHQKVALNKVITTKNETYHFVENDGKLYFINDDHPAFNAFRVNQGLSILEDLQLIKGIKGSFMITSLGQVKLSGKN